MSKSKTSGIELESNEINLLSEISSSILISNDDLDKTLQTILHNSLKLINAKYGNVMILDGDDLVIKATTTEPPEEEIGRRLEISSSVSGKSIITMGTVVIPDVEKEELYQRILTSEHMRSEIATPLIDGQHAIGVLNVESEKVDAFSSHQVALLEFIAGLAVIAFNQAYSNQVVEALRNIDEAILRKDVSLDTTLQDILDTSKRLIKAKHGNLLLLKGDQLEIRATTTPKPLREKELYTRINIHDSVSGLPVIQGKTIIIPDVSKEQKYQRVLEQEEIQSEMASPLRIDEKIIGVLNFESPALNGFTGQDKKFIEALAGQAAIAIQFSAYEELFRQLREIDHKILNSAFNLENVFETILASALQFIDSKFCDILMAKGDKLTIVASTVDELVGQEIDIENSVCGKSFKEMKAINVPDSEKESLYRNVIAEGLPQTRSELVAPMIRDGISMGVINVENVSVNSFSEQDEEVLVTLAGSAALAITTAQHVEDLIQSELAKGTAEMAKSMVHKIGDKAALSIKSVAQVMVKNIEPGNKSMLDGFEEIITAAEQIIEIKRQLLKPFLPVAKIEGVNLLKVIKTSIELSQVPPDILQLKIEENLPLAKADYYELSDVISELLINARFALDETEKKEIEIEGFVNSIENCIELKVRDNGKGIPPEEIDNIWTWGRTMNDAKGGTGFGLFQVTQFLAKVGGKISVSSRQGEGALFTLLLPIWDESKDPS